MYREFFSNICDDIFCARCGGKMEMRYMEFNNDIPLVNEDKCMGCGRCEYTWPTIAIKILNRKAEIDPLACLGC